MWSSKNVRFTRQLLKFLCLNPYSWQCVRLCVHYLWSHSQVPPVSFVLQLFTRVSFVKSPTLLGIYASSFSFFYYYRSISLYFTFFREEVYILFWDILSRSLRDKNNKQYKFKPLKIKLGIKVVHGGKNGFSTIGCSYWGFPDSSVGKESACNAGDPSSIPGLGRSTGKGIGYPLQYSWASLVAQLVKNPPAMWETWVQSLGWEEPLEKGKATHSSILAWRIHGPYSPRGHKESDTTEWLSLSCKQ